MHPGLRELAFHGRTPDPTSSPLLSAPLPSVTSTPEHYLRSLLAEARSWPTMPRCEQVGRVLEWLRLRLHRRVCVERSGGSIAYANRLVTLWPDARYVHLWRDGTEVCRSMSEHPYFRVLVARLAARNGSMPVAACLKTEVPLETYGRYWSASICKGVSALNRLSGHQVLHVGFERLLESPQASLEPIGRFLGLSSQEAADWTATVSGSVHVEHTTRPPLSEQERTRVERACKPGRDAISGASQRSGDGPTR